MRLTRNAARRIGVLGIFFGIVAALRYLPARYPDPLWSSTWLKFALIVAILAVLRFGLAHEMLDEAGLQRQRVRRSYLLKAAACGGGSVGWAYLSTLVLPDNTLGVVIMAAPIFALVGAFMVFFYLGMRRDGASDQDDGG